MEKESCREVWTSKRPKVWKCWVETGKVTSEQKIDKASLGRRQMGYLRQGLESLKQSLLELTGKWYNLFLFLLVNSRMPMHFNAVNELLNRTTYAINSSIQPQLTYARPQWSLSLSLWPNRLVKQGDLTWQPLTWPAENNCHVPGVCLTHILCVSHTVCEEPHGQFDFWQHIHFEQQDTFGFSVGGSMVSTAGMPEVGGSKKTAQQAVIGISNHFVGIAFATDHSVITMKSQWGPDQIIQWTFNDHC